MWYFTFSQLPNLLTANKHSHRVNDCFFNDPFTSLQNFSHSKFHYESRLMMRRNFLSSFFFLVAPNFKTPLFFTERKKPRGWNAEKFLASNPLSGTIISMTPNNKSATMFVLAWPFYKISIRPRMPCGISRSYQEARRNVKASWQIGFYYLQVLSFFAFFSYWWHYFVQREALYLCRDTSLPSSFYLRPALGTVSIPMRYPPDTRHCTIGANTQRATS